MFQEYFLYLAIVLLFLDLQKFLFHVYNQHEKIDHTYFYHFSIFSTENGLFSRKECNVILVNDVICADSMKHDLQNVVFVLHHLP